MRSLDSILPYLVVVLITTTAVVAYSSSFSTVCVVNYLINSVVIEPSSEYSGLLYLESPANITYLGINQTVRIALSRGLTLESGVPTVRVTQGVPAYAYVVFEVRTCSKDFNTALALVREALINPIEVLRESTYYGEEIPTEFLREPPEVVKSEVRGAFEDWLRDFAWYRFIDNLSRAPLLVSIYAARFVYNSGYIKYSAHLLPQTLEDVLKSREGDCDDMSRLLAALLWSYGVPAVIAYGYVAIPGFSMRSSIGGFEYVFSEGGSHAFVLAYISGHGWVSLDFLAGSLLTYSFVFWGTTTNVEIAREVVKEVEEFHMKLAGRQFMAVLSPGDPRLKDVESLENYVNTSLSLRVREDRVPPITQTEVVTSTVDRPGVGSPLNTATVGLVLLTTTAALIALLALAIKTWLTRR
ncbi:MAG: transglutaminase-like domain-containing protein [Sulfolobales archaeon]|nr:transglutaminase-like domain-containing protein [Sulfolobales archaeon]MDW8082464.1 transglutaminase-like domain-containing protein [Sulfolobales archaeon]